MKFSIGKYNQDTLGGLLISLLLSTGILISLTMVCFYVYLPGTTHHGETITVPNIEGMKLTELENFLTRDLQYEVSDSAYSAEYPPLTVLRQYPREGEKVKEGRKIYISVNRVTPPTVPLPDLIDGSVINAETVLLSNELKRGRIELIAGPFNIVKEMKYHGISMGPNTRVPKGSVIDLVVTDGSIVD